MIQYDTKVSFKTAKAHEDVVDFRNIRAILLDLRSRHISPIVISFPIVENSTSCIVISNKLYKSI